jgi:enamine deaminase RidA (YjgF/YER057c/UK114 family)
VLAPADPVEMRCVAQPDGTLALTRLREKDRERAKIEGEGAFTAAGTTISVAVGTLAVSCEVPPALAAAVAALPASARIEIECEVKDGKAVLEEVEVDPEGVEQEVTGTLEITPGVPPATTTVAVGGITCTVENPALLGTLANGEIVEITCVAGKLVRIHPEE